MSMLSWFGLARPRDLRRKGILGMNRRNADYILPGNPRAHYPRVDDKLITKTICEARGIRVPRTYAVIEHHADIRRFAEAVADHPDFVIKPCRGAEGRGIVVVLSHDQRTFTTAGGRMSLADVRYHLSNVLSGLYSLAGQSDRAIIEHRLVRHSVFESIAIGGTPDIRIILYRHIPAMAMVRLPTRASRGRANLHQGAIAAAVNLATGRTFGGVWQNRPVEAHPDTGSPIAGVEIPMWQQLLTQAMQLADGLEMNYVGVDFVLDATLGPVILEANARPGLAIQIANRHGILPRLQRIDELAGQGMSIDARLELACGLAQESPLCGVPA